MYYSLFICRSLTLLGVFHEAVAVFFGTPAEEGQFPHMACLELLNLHAICSGSIISSRHVLTAAHCVACSQEQDVKVIVGKINVNEEGVERYDAEKIHKHRRFETPSGGCCNRYVQAIRKYFIPQDAESQWNYDIAVIKSVALPAKDMPSAPVLDFAGFGYSEVKEHNRGYLRFIKMILLKPTSYFDYGIETPLENALYVRLKAYDTEIVIGDSGSPLVHNNIVYGVESRTEGQEGPTTIFMKVKNFLRFINDAMKV